jgi:caffeoyl-CoA O-methyltransferase
MYQKVHRYLERLTPPRPPVLREMERYAEDNDFPIIGPLVGRYLYQMTILIKARRILELGSGFGYSAFWFSLATRGKGHITLTDYDRRNKSAALDYFKRAGLESHLEFRVGDALEIARKLEGPFDMILLDIHKEDYPRAIDLAASRLRQGGLFVADNVIWSGKVMDKAPDKATQSIIEFTRELYQDTRFFTTIVPIRDGLSVAVRL